MSMRHRVTPTISITAITRITSNFKLCAKRNNNKEEEVNLCCCRPKQTHHHHHHLINDSNNNKTFRQRNVWQIALLLFTILLLPTLPTISAKSFKTYDAYNDKIHLKSIGMQNRLNQRRIDNNDNVIHTIPIQPRAGRERHISNTGFEQKRRIPMFKPMNVDLRPLMISNNSKIMEKPYKSIIAVPTIATNTKSYLSSVGDNNFEVHSLYNRERDNLENRNDDQLSLEKLLTDYVTKFFEKGKYEPLPGLLIELKKNFSTNVGITSGSAPLFIRPIDAPQELDFRDNALNFDEDNKFMVTVEDDKDNPAFAYNQAEASQISNQYAYNSINPATRLTLNERQHQLMQDSYLNALQSLGSASFKNSGSLSGSLSAGSSSLLSPTRDKPAAPANINRFHSFKKVPDSTLLLSNYDPFYSPLLSRLDSVFAQLKLNSSNEICREKVICLMYASPAKYAPYSNLVSAQLSRELNELRKPTSDNPDILRFFKYMRAAKEGQDGADCEEVFNKCTEFKDFENPAMVNTYHDIDKLVQARKLSL
uniref:Uncharacterized protein n=1 Tax=Glossina brevipalpis TaxID=37001 RepID=A0A1A9W5L9_9MUSC